MYVPRTEFVSCICVAVPKQIDKLLSMQTLHAIGLAHWSSHCCPFLDANVRYHPHRQQRNMFLPRGRGYVPQKV